MKREIAAACLCLGAALAPAAPVGATVETRDLVNLTLDAAPLDLAATPDGQSVFVLTQGGEVLILSPDGKIRDRFTLAEPADSIAVSPRGEALILGNRERKTLRILRLDSVRVINTSDAPFKGPADAPVTIALFTDFQ